METFKDYKFNETIDAKEEMTKTNNNFLSMNFQSSSKPIQMSEAPADNYDTMYTNYGHIMRNSLLKLDQLCVLLHHSTGTPRQLVDVIENLMEQISVVKRRFLESIAEFQSELYELTNDLVLKTDERNTTKSGNIPERSDGLLEEPKPLKMSKSPFLVCVSAKNIFKQRPTLLDYISMACEIYNIQSDLKLLINKINLKLNTKKKGELNPNQNSIIYPINQKSVAVQTEDFLVSLDLNRNEINMCDKAVSVSENLMKQVVKPKLLKSPTCYANYLPPVEIMNSNSKHKQYEESNGSWLLGYPGFEESLKKRELSLISLEKCEEMKKNSSTSHIVQVAIRNEQLHPISSGREKKGEIRHKCKEIKRKIHGDAVRLISENLKTKAEHNSRAEIQDQASSLNIVCKASKCNCLHAVYEVLKGCHSRKASTVIIPDTNNRSNSTEVEKKNCRSERVENVHRKKDHRSRRGKNSPENKVKSDTAKQPIKCDGITQIEKLLTLSNHHEKVTISPTTSEVVHYVNDSHIVICNFPKEAKAQWIAPTGDVITEKKGRVHVEERKSGQLALVFEQIALVDKGEWTCMIEDGAKKSFGMVINRPISFMDTAIMQSAKEGKDANIRCEVGGDPEPTVSWSFNGKSIILPHAKFTKLADGLLIKKVSKNDSGEYTCRAFQISETINEVDERVILLKIEHKPLPVEKSADVQYGYINGVVNLTCEALAEPQANFTWYRHGKKISPKAHQIFVGNHSSMLQIPIKEATAFGDYKCKATNPLGFLEKTIKLQEGTKPDPPTQFTLRGVNSDTFDIDVGAVRTSNIRDEMDINGYTFQAIPEHEWRASGGNWEKAREFKFGFEDGVTFLLSNLAPNTTYMVRVASKNLAGLSDWTDTKKFTTYPKEPMMTSAFNRICPFSAWDTLTIATVTTFVSSYAASDSINILRFFHVIL